MKNRLMMAISLVAVIVLVVFALVRSRPAPVDAVPRNSSLDAPRIESQELRAQLERGAVIVLDVRDADSYIAGHIPGALQIPLSRVDGEIPYLPKDKPIVAYCT